MGTDFTVNFNEYMPLRDLVYTTLRQAILKGELQPGERLMEIQLAEKMGVSRTPIREAIRRLEKEGLVIMVPRKGAEVAGISEKMLKDVLEIRMTLEELALKLAITRAGLEDIQKLEEAEKAFREAIEGAKLISMAEADEQFHFVIYDAAGNEKLKEILHGLKENMYRYRLEYLKDENYRKSLIREHDSIIEAFKNKDVASGMDVTERHIKNQEKAVITRVRQEEKEREKKPKKR
ncbi:MAG: GntR family transcriptional regulator [Eubacteriales bacterium]|nr:GntR family transcriptional regulator [Eubacteriales bacterium]